MNRILWLTACMFVLVYASRAQDVLSSPPMSAPSASAMQDFNANQPGTIPVPDASLGISPLPTPFHLGPLDLRPHFLYRFLYGNGIPARPGQDTKTSINEISPGVLLQLGSHWSVDYTPTYYSYSSSEFSDHLDQALHLNFGTTYHDWVFNLNHTFADTSTPLVETGQQTDQQNHNTSLDAFYSLNNKWSLQLNVVQNLRFTAGFNDLHEWSTTDWLVYQWAPHLQVSAGISGTYDNVESGSDMASQQYLGRVTWNPGPKTSFEVHGGIEDRQILASRAGDLINPVFGTRFTYTPFEFTDLTLGADRIVTPTFFQDQVTEKIDFNGSIRQRFFSHYFFTITGNYYSADYVGTIFNLPILRHDNYYSVNFRLTTAIFKRGSISVFYTLSDNSSDIALFDFSSHQGGVELGFAY